MLKPIKILSRNQNPLLVMQVKVRKVGMENK